MTRLFWHYVEQCVENQQPSLKGLPLGIRQKGILATCNYVARRKGVGKLTTLAEAKRLCPDLVIVDGEDLSPFRDVSKRLYALLRSFSWSGKVERLGLDEIFLDVTDIVSYNLELLNENSLRQSYFCLSKQNPEHGFGFDATSFAGCVEGLDDEKKKNSQNPPLLYMRLLLASHLARYLRLQIENEGYTTACGISTNKLLAKLVGNKNKPRNQTTLLALDDETVYAFMDGHGLRKVPGIGSKITRILEGYVLGTEMEPPDVHSMECSVTVGQVRCHPGLQSPLTLDDLLGRRGSERGLAGKVWALLHGVDDSEVKPARDVPTQISIEDTYKGLNDMSEIRREMVLIAASLLRRMHVDLLAADDEPDTPKTTQGSRSRKWLACPRTIRLTTRPYTSPADNKPYGWARASRSTALPGFVLSLSMTPDQIVEKLVAETLMPLFHKLNPAPRGWNTGLINICVTNMVGGGTANDGGTTRDIGVMFRRQDDLLKEFTVYDDEAPASAAAAMAEEKTASPEKEVPAVAVREVDEEDEGDESWEEEEEHDDGGHGSSQGESNVEPCPLCGHVLPLFALAAHERFHAMEMDGD
ncbi:hypothetical protein QBC47DRAFT_369144 [Echria macrotheca]|uniref:UmuC domain-containing protein n=1 Tax=Echria macrotheca TaxID=438768 RepID=A0AAJ0FGK3_9PEZI|nr:hypothetical protein QBC47DRAFT_369144 [Echria macrotheca]